MNPDYLFGAQLLAHIAPPSAADEMVAVQVDSRFDGDLSPVDGVDAGAMLLRRMEETRRILREKQPERAVVFGGDCSVSQVPFDYLLDVADFPAAVGRMTLAQVARLLGDIAEEAEIVGLSLAEHMPWDALNLRAALSKISIFQG